MKASMSRGTADAHGVQQLDTALKGMYIQQTTAVTSVPPPMSMQPELLNEIFRFKFKPPSECQDELVCKTLVKHFGAFVASIRPVTVTGFTFSVHDPLVDDRVVPLNAFASEELEALERVSAILTRKWAVRRRGDIWVEKWLPQYGCALQMEMASASSLALKLVFLDSWEHVVHFPPTGDCIHSAVPKKFAVLHCGVVHPRNRDKLLDGLSDEIAKAKERTGANRSAAFNEIGHQKTPQFIAMLLRSVLASLDPGHRKSSGSNVSATRGGTTDVGLHTGGRSRDTCWPLVQGIVKQNLPGSGALFDKAMLMFQFSLLSGRLNDVGLHAARLSDAPAHTFWTDVEDTFAMLQRVGLQIVELVQRGYDAGTLEKKCAVVRKHLFTYIGQINARTAEKFKLPSSSALDEISSSMKHQIVPQLDYKNVFNQPAAVDFDPEADARLQLKYYVFVNPTTCPTASLIQWISHGDSSSARKTIHLVALRTIERFLFQKASFLDGGRYESDEYDSDESEDDSDCTPAQLQTILQQYEKHLFAWKQAALGSSILDVEQRSHVLLVKWIAFCLVHQTFAAKYKDLRAFGIALQWQNLGIAVLRDEAAIEALSTVAAYIRTWNASGHDPVFDLNDQAPTARFARAFASTSETYLSRYKHETERLDRCIATNWSTIVRKKAEVVAICNEIDEIDELIEEWDEKLQDEKDAIEEANLELPPNLRRQGNSETKRCKDQIRSLKSWRHWQTKQLALALQMPAFVKSPLPKDRASALQTLFFIDMPGDIALLFELCLSAQRALASRQLSQREKQALDVTVKGVTWRSFFTANGGTAPSSSDAFTTLSAYHELLRAPNNHGPNSIESVRSQEDVAKQCVWYPTASDTHVVWTDASGGATNPFKISLEMMLAFFTHELPASFKTLQWAIAYPGGANRGNLVYSKLGEQLPDDFEKSSFVLFGSLRAYPHQQIRKLCCALKDNVLPWSHPCVAAVVRQAMYQVGQLSDETLPQSVWKTDLRRADGLQVLCAAIEQAASRLDLTPRDFEHAPLLGELAGFISQFSKSASKTVRKFVAMCRRWADDIRTQWQSDRAMSSADVTELRGKECLLYGYALQSYALGELSNADLKAIGELIVLFRNAMLFANGSTTYTAILRLEVTVDEIMARRIAAIQAYYHSDQLTALVRLVNTRAPSTLAWQYYTYKLAGYYESYWVATDNATGTHYAINQFTGAILTDGNSPGGLPSHIRQSTKYRTLFGEQDFEVAFAKGVYRTAYAVQGCYYEFAVVQSELHVREVYCNDDAQVIKTLDLCASTWQKTLATALPARIMALHSLWYWVEQECILVRPRAASEQRVEFFVMLTKASVPPRRVIKAFQVPATDAELPHATLLEQRQRYDSFVKVDETLLAVVRKFEVDKYIHTLCTSDGMLKIHLPRFRLSFLLTDACALRSLEYEGYVLDPQQQFEDAFPNFHRYLVLRLEAASAFAKPKTRLVVPLGDVVKRPNGVVDVALPDLASARLEVAVFDVHRRLKTLVTESITSRLLLCTLLVSTGLNTPSKFFKMTGSEAALQVLKGCYFSHEFSQRDKDLALNLCLFGHREPGLKILASCILQKSVRCSFLTTDDSDAALSVSLIDCTNELDEYCAMGVQTPERNPLRTCLDATEERLVLGYTLQHETTAKRLRGSLVDLTPPPVPATLVRDVEETLARFLADTTQSSVPALQLTLVDSDAMSRAMNAELHDSWVAYHAHPDKKLAQSLESLASTCELMLTNVCEKRARVEQYLLDAVASSRNDVASRLLVTINYLPTPTISDIIRSSFDNDVLLQLVPRLSAHARSIFKAATLQFMELCVLEDKLQRLLASAQQQPPPSDSYFVDELSSVRRWSSSEHPYWLAFEVEGRLQIRHEQFVVAQHLINNAGAVCQMNMGRGKTRVILPMLFLYFSQRHRNQRIVRAHFLTPLLSETRQFMHQYLSASSILSLNFVELPFHRNIELTTGRLHLLREALDEARECGKFLMVAPEHRMSLELKKLDLEASIENSEVDDDYVSRCEMTYALAEILNNDQYIDILDECDAILHHKYHLIYAVGVPQKLASGESRWLAVEALLRVLTSASSQHVRQVLQYPHVSFQSPEYASRLGGFNGLRLNASVANKDAVRKAFREALVLDLMDDPPFSLLWLKAHASHATDANRQRLVTALTDPSVNLESMLSGGGDDPVLLQYQSPLLALRGLIAFGILEHCLEKRHRVEFGLPEPKTRAKRMAIPFRAADIPSERSEFSHPEVGITLTVLAYYHSGLRASELKEALTQLLLLGAAEQAQFYAKWFDAVRTTISLSDLKELPRDANQLSPRDSRQFAHLYRVYRYSMEAINFFLNTCVFPSDTTQFPQRLSRTAWHLAGGSWNIGFSGTNDNHRLLPTSMRQHEPNEPSLLGTNGKMIDRILKVAVGYEIIHSDQSAAIPWQVLLQSAMTKRVHALIDTGALLAGVLNNDAALYLLELDGFTGFAGVTYYDTRKQYDCWVVVDAASRLVTPLKRATIVEKDTFVIFDDARSRGSDMKLKPDAVAMLTLGPKITKDKLMQGAGRMRQLGSNQRLWLASLGEVAQSIVQFRDRASVQQIQIVDILDWVMYNTKSEAVHGLLEWASSGLQFGESQDDPGAELVREDWSLHSLYAPAHRADLITNIVHSKATAVLGTGDATLDALVDTICARSAVFGLDEEVLVTSHNEECERELHNEHFEEQEDEVEHARCRPADEVAWDFDALLRISSARQLSGTVDVVALGDFVETSLAPPMLAQLNWASAQFFGTRNFFATIAVPASSSSRMNAHARVVDAMLLFDDGSKLLVSEFEADAILYLLWRSSTARLTFSFVHLPYLVETVEKFGKLASLASVALSLRSNTSLRSFPRLLDPTTSTLCQLYNGETMFTKTQHELLRDVLRRLLQPLAQREHTFQTFAEERGNLPKWRYSLLHELCHEMDLEAIAAPKRTLVAPNPFVVSAATGKAMAAARKHFATRATQRAQRSTNENAR